MVMARFSLALVTSALALLASGTPMLRRLAAIPREASKLAVDDLTKRVIAYDARDNYLGFMERDALAVPYKRDGSCSALSADEAQKLPGWDTLKATAQSNWGKGSWHIVTNDDDYPTEPASVCAQDAGNVVVKGDPQCTVQTQSLETTIVGTNGTATVSQTSGTLYSSSQTVTQSASLSIDRTVTVSVGIPEVADVSASTTLSTSMTNTLAVTTTSESNQQTTQTVSIAVPDGATCSVTFKETSCTTRGSGQVPFTATGWVWFEYNDKTHGHYKWALNMDNILSEADRSSYMKFDAVVSTDTKGQYNAEC